MEYHSRCGTNVLASHHWVTTGVGDKPLGEIGYKMEAKAKLKYHKKMAKL